MSLTRLIAYAIAMVLVMDWACGAWDRTLALAFWLLGWKLPSFHAAAGSVLVLIGVIDCLHRLVSRGRRKT